MGRAARDDPRSRRRAGREVRRRLRAEAWAAVRSVRRPVLVFLGAYLGVVLATAAATRLLGGSSFSVGFNVGLLVGLLPFFGLGLLVASGIPHRAMGADAEEWTAAELAKLDTRRWAVFHHIPHQRGDIDHVVIGPGRVYAVETKWTARSDLDRFLRGAGWQAERQAEALQALLSARGVSREVVPLLVVWGPGVAVSFGEKPRMVGKTRAVAGAHAVDWLGRMNAVIDRLEIDWPAQQAVEAHVREAETQTVPG